MDRVHMNTEHKLEVLLDGIAACLDEHHKIRSVYDEQVAFDFNYTRLFEPKENKTSDILAFLLNPREKHGQKSAFLKLFLKQFGLEDTLALVSEGTPVRVCREDFTADRRRIDITIRFGDHEPLKCVIGIENKIRAVDQNRQLTDYVKELQKVTKDSGDWALFYLTPDGTDPSETSIERSFKDKLEQEGKLFIISYKDHIIEFIGQCEIVCKAESVRAFLKDFNQYLRRQYRGETTMGEQQVIENYLREHPTFIPNVRHLNATVTKLRDECRGALLNELSVDLKTKGIIVKERMPGPGYSLNPICLAGRSIDYANTNIPTVIQCDSKNDWMILRAGVWASDHKMLALFEIVRKQFPADAYRENGAWRGGYYEVYRGEVLSDDNLVVFMTDSDKLKSFVSQWVASIERYMTIVAEACNRENPGAPSRDSRF